LPLRADPYYYQGIATLAERGPMSNYHVLKTRNAPPSLFAAGKGVGRRFPLVLTAVEHKQHRAELLRLKGQGYITIEEVPELTLETSDGRTVEDILVEATPEPEPVTEELAEEIDEARAEPEAEALDEKPEEVVEVPPEPDPEVYDLSLLDQSVKALIQDLDVIDDPGWLRALRAAENLGKTRKSAVAAIKERLEALKD